MTGAERALVATRLAWGAALVARPGTLVRAAGGDPDGRSRTVARVLGARHLLQGAAALRWGAPAQDLGVVVDALHAASAAALAGLDRSRRRVAALDAGVAAAMALAGACVPSSKGS